MTISVYYRLFEYMVDSILEFPPTLLVFALILVASLFRIVYRFIYGSY